MKNRVLPIPVEDYIDINDPNIQWFSINDFPGYECAIINSSMLIRSLKSPNVHPFGTLLRLDSNNKFELTNRNNQRIKISAEEIQKLMDKSKWYYTLYPEVYKARNNRAFINPDAESSVGTIIKKPSSIRVDREKVELPSFNIPDNIYREE